MKLKNYIWDFVIIGILGAVGHFFYKWTGNNTIIGYFFPVNESTWEHLKLLFFPTVLFSIIEFYVIKPKAENYIPSVAISLVVGLMAIVAIFYTYSGVLGFKIEWFNIAIYYIALIVMLLIKALFISTNVAACRLAVYISLFWILAMAIMFIVFTYNPPMLAIFKEM